MYNPTIRAPARFWANRSLAIKGLVVIALPLAVLLGSLSSLYLASNAEARAEDDVRRAFAIQRDTYQVHALLAERGFAQLSLSIVKKLCSEAAHHPDRATSA